ncbi:lipase maturation factor family protein [Nocardia sp. ET3-3]|uniref:Lipase maturation factor family protein n=1 Tax=Nocardia terrae TaxID=2675851 RepID=A0A7K1UNF8_9NOCA|nr:lipase maturation factor family protein [Nocardia terrae]MVU75851.1 lipase maturation factor family protein [Nocardia terrae]
MAWFIAPEYWFARQVLERGVAVVYVLAFVAAARQFKALIGADGMLPVPRYLARRPFRVAPSVFQWHYSDRFFAIVAWGGAVVSAALVGGAADVVPLWAAMALWLLVWVLYLSIVNVGQVWYSFGWESLLLEAGFLVIFLGNDSVAPPVLVVWLARWLVFRVEFGAGLIKLRGDRCWRDLTALYYHHETQPMPGPLSWLFHHLPKPLHRIEAAANHVVQLVVPFGLFAPQPVASVAAAIIVVTQLWLVLSGNFAWLNWLTIILAWSAISDSSAARLFPVPGAPDMGRGPLWFTVLGVVFAVVTVVLSYLPVRNMLSRRQRMNQSYNPFHLINTFGAFGSIDRVRYEVVVEGTDETVLTEHTHWSEYEFKGKPGDPHRLPRQWAPYHLRLDWMLWFAAHSPTYARPWFPEFLERLLRNDPATLRLLRRNPFPDAPPRFVRARLYEYRFSTVRELRDTRAWWVRGLVSEYAPPLASRRAPLARRT